MGLSPRRYFWYFSKSDSKSGTVHAGVDAVEQARTCAGSSVAMLQEFESWLYVPDQCTKIVHTQCKPVHTQCKIVYTQKYWYLIQAVKNFGDQVFLIITTRILQ
jgi:hypothetical protein